MIAILIVCSLLFSTNCFAQEARTEFGLLGGASFNNHSASFSQLGDFASCCPEFTGGSGWGGTLGAFATIPLGGVWRFQGRLVYAGDHGTLTHDEGSFVADLRDTARVVPAVFRHELTASLTSIGIEPYIALRPVGGLDLMFGGRIALVTSSSFVQTETLAEPEDYGEFLGSGRTWVNHDAEIPDASSIRATISMGLRYVVPLNSKGTFFAAPELFYHIPVTGVADGVSWTVSELRLGIEIGWSPARDKPVLDTAQSLPVVPMIAAIPAPPASTLIVSVEGIDEAGNPSRLDSIHIEETRVVDFLPVLGHIFFADGSAQIPDRYNTQRGDAASINEPMAAIHDLLPLIASRMVEHPDVTVTVIGATSNTTTDKGLPLARSRAESVKDVLVLLGVSEDRISLEARKLPKMPTRSSDPNEQTLADEENRRVEIVPSDATLLEPVILTSIRRTVTPKYMSVRALADAPSGVVSLSTDVTPSLQSAPDSIRELDQTADRVVSLESLINEPTSTVIATGSLVDSAGQSVTDTARVPVSVLTVERKRSESRADEEIERYSLILFAFDDASITDEHERLLERIRQRMEQGATVRIIGMTDAMGSSRYNRDLSRRRAVRVARALRMDESAIEAVGDTQPRFANGIPEGRAYNRTVVIEVKMRR